MYKILAGLYYTSCPQGVNILIGTTHKNISQNQVGASVEVQTKYCV